MMMKVLVAGWFSFEQMGASAGDLLTRDLVCQWLDSQDRPYDVALAPPFEGGIDWRSASATNYSHVVFVCGPFGNGPPVDEMLDRFTSCDWIGINLSMLQPLSEWNPFQLLLERDSSLKARPDLAFLSDAPRAPVVGTILIDSQPEYGDWDLHETADAAISEFLRSRDTAVLAIDTRLDENKTGCSTSAQVEALISRADVVITTRLHGLVLSLKNGIPAVAIDTVRGGAKVTRQAKTIGWTTILAVEKLARQQLEQAFEFCLTEQARLEARGCSDRARALLQDVKSDLQQFLATRDSKDH
jgi:hypothetical protein